MKVEGETAYCVDINTNFKNGYKTRADASTRMSYDQISDVALSIEYVNQYVPVSYTHLFPVTLSVSFAFPLPDFSGSMLNAKKTGAPGFQGEPLGFCAEKMCIRDRFHTVLCSCAGELHTDTGHRTAISNTLPRFQIVAILDCAG